jgi:hypothetical protein
MPQGCCVEAAKFDNNADYMAARNPAAISEENQTK